jgi:hypothetical protein
VTAGARAVGSTGCGDIATRGHLPPLAENPSVRLLAVGAPIEEPARRFAVPEVTTDAVHLRRPADRLGRGRDAPSLSLRPIAAALFARVDISRVRPMVADVETAKVVAGVERGTYRFVEAGSGYRDGPFFVARR